MKRWLRYILRRSHPVFWYTRRAEIARARGDWTRAARLFAKAVRWRPAGDLLVQLAHALKESGDRAGAATAYRVAIRRCPGNSDPLIHLAALLCDDEPHAPEIVDLYRRVLVVDPDNIEAASRLAQRGRRDLVPAAAVDRALLAARAAKLATLRHDLQRYEDAIAATMALPIALYGDFRARHPIGPPPDVGATTMPSVIIFSANASATLLRATIDSALGQTLAAAAILVVGDDRWRDHPLTSVTFQRPEIRWIAADPIAHLPSGNRMVLLLNAGTLLDREALAWLDFGWRRTASDALYSDHDDVSEDWRKGRNHARPVFFGIHDPHGMAAGGAAPLAVLMKSENVAERLSAHVGQDCRVSIRQLLLTAERPVHVPRVLASRFRLSGPALSAPSPSGGPVTDAVDMPMDAPRPSAGLRPKETGSITVVIPTRNKAHLVAGMIDSLRNNAGKPDRLRFIIANNRSSADETQRLINLSKTMSFHLEYFDEPFNWSRCNNHCARLSPSAQLVFANNDMKMISNDWDHVLDEQLADRQTGACGARLLYPGGGYQHAGILFAHDRHSLTVHEGVGHDGAEGGPDDRWRRSRQASAVTGAFLATTRRVFEMVGGFDERLAIAYNDIDYCFRVRERKCRVLYVPAITLIHFESETRGRNVTREEVSWDESEQAVLARRWQGALRREPAYNPHWSRDAVAFDGLREPTLDEQLRWIDLGMRQGWSL